MILKLGACIRRISSEALHKRGAFRSTAKSPNSQTAPVGCLLHRDKMSCVALISCGVYNQTHPQSRITVLYLIDQTLALITTEVGRNRKDKTQDQGRNVKLGSPNSGNRSAQSSVVPPLGGGAPRPELGTARQLCRQLSQQRGPPAGLVHVAMPQEKAPFHHPTTRQLRRVPSETPPHQPL